MEQDDFKKNAPKKDRRAETRSDTGAETGRAETGRAVLKNLPKEIPIFPLDGALLLPGGRLPLRIFEPRYLAMVHDALHAPHRLIGMAQTKEGNARGATAPILHDTGCIGWISSFEETQDGRYLIDLDGIIRFKIVKELKMKDGYRSFAVCYDAFIEDFDTTPADIDRERLFKALRPYFDHKGLKADWAAMTSCDSDKLITILSMICPLGDRDKQMLLEAPTPSDRAETLAALLEMANSERIFNTQGKNNVCH